jgi:hypothetical protein
LKYTQGDSQSNSPHWGPTKGHGSSKLQLCQLHREPNHKPKSSTAPEQHRKGQQLLAASATQRSILHPSFNQAPLEVVLNH